LIAAASLPANWLKPRSLAILPNTALKIFGTRADALFNMSKFKQILLVGGAVLFGGLFVVTGWFEYRDTKKLASEGKAVVAQVLEKDIERGRRGRKSYYVSVQFKTESGATVQQRLRVSSSQYDAASPGGTVPAHYLPNDPTVCQVGEKVEAKWSGILIGLGAWLVAGMLGFSNSDDEEEGGSGSGDGTAIAQATPNDAGSNDQQQAA